jgi:hypothetical protein
MQAGHLDEGTNGSKVEADWPARSSPRCHRTTNSLSAPTVAVGAAREERTGGTQSSQRWLWMETRAVVAGAAWEERGEGRNHG